jgi:hypothetical protein
MNNAGTALPIAPAQHKAQEHKLQWFEVITAILMALSTLSTAWCSFETSQWNAKSGDQMAAATRSQQKAALLHMQGNQALMVHVQIFTELINARLQGNDKLLQFYTDRLSPEMRKAYEAWLAEKPFENPKAPPHPFVPQFYQACYVEEVKQANIEAARRGKDAKRMSRIGSKYLSNTVLLAGVLFFAGTAGKFHQRRVRHPSLVFAVMLFLYTAVRMSLLAVA